VISAAPNRPLRAALIVMPLLFAAVVLVQIRIDRTTRLLAQQQEELLLRSAPVLRRLSLGYDSLLADIYWTRAVQYYGSRVTTPGANYHLLWPLLDVTTALDPHLIVAYRFGAIFLSEPEAGANRTDLAIELVKRGIAANPNEWRLGTDLGLLYYLRMRDDRQAAEAYLEASKIPGAPVWINMMAARIAQRGGSLETSRIVWEQLYESTNDPSIRKRAAEQIQSLKAQDDEMHLDELAAEYQRRFAHFPVTSHDLVAAGLLPGVPVDPAGFPYVFGPDRKFRLHPASPIEIIPPPKQPPQPNQSP
jgi:hypothetical protein